jgi:ERCC4-type nuclease
MGWAAMEVGSRRFMAREMMGYLNTLAVKTGAIVLYSNSKTDTVQQIVALYHWWQKPWADHVSHLARNKVARETSLVRPGLVRRMAAELPLVGWGKSKSVEERFSTVVEMVNATEEEWRAIPGVGKKMSKEIYLQLRGGIYDKRKI